MCEAIEGIRNDAIMEGKIKTLSELVNDGLLTIAEAADRADMSISEFEEISGLKA